MHKKNSSLLLKKFPRQRAKQMPSKVLFVVKKEKATTAAVWSLRAKLVIVGNSKLVQKHHFWRAYFSLFQYTLKQLFTSVSVASGGGYLPRRFATQVTPLATSTSMNNCYIYAYRCTFIYNYYTPHISAHLIYNYVHLIYTLYRPMYTSYSAIYIL